MNRVIHLFQRPGKWFPPPLVTLMPAWSACMHARRPKVLPCVMPPSRASKHLAACTHVPMLSQTFHKPVDRSNRLVSFGRYRNLFATTSPIRTGDASQSHITKDVGVSFTCALHVIRVLVRPDCTPGGTTSSYPYSLTLPSVLQSRSPLGRRCTAHLPSLSILMNRVTMTRGTK